MELPRDLNPEYGPRHYDQATQLAKLPLEDSPWLKLYAFAIVLLPFSILVRGKIADLGCGTGRFARFLHACGCTQYWGLDFSCVCIGMAKEYVPQYDFEVGDMFAPRYVAKASQFDCVVLLEVLEHIRYDTMFLELLPHNQMVLASVPSFAGPGSGHVRCFQEWEEVEERYGGILEFNRKLMCQLTKEKRFFVFLATKR